MQFHVNYVSTSQELCSASSILFSFDKAYGRSCLILCLDGLLKNKDLLQIKSKL